jgi:hypothetical protein
VALAGLTVNLFTLYSKGYSPQFIVQLMPFAVLLLPSLRGIAYIILLDVINFLEATVYFIMLPDERWLLVTTVLLRTLLIIALSFEYGLILFNVRSARVTTLHRRASIALLACVAVVLCALVYPLGQAYLSSRRQAELSGPISPLVEADSYHEASNPCGGSFLDPVIMLATSPAHSGAWPSASQPTSTVVHDAAWEHAPVARLDQFPHGQPSP